MSLNASGGNFKCYHGIDTDDVNEWNEHCSDPANGHTESGTTLCTDCGGTVVFEGLAYRKIDAAGSKNINLQCPECKEAQKADNVQVMKIDNPSQGYRMLEPHEKNNSQQQGGESPQ